MAADPNDMRNWWEVAGAFLAGFFGLRGVQVLRSKNDTTLEDVCAAIRKDGEDTRKVLTAMRTDIAILLDRDDHRGGR